MNGSDREAAALRDRLAGSLDLLKALAPEAAEGPEDPRMDEEGLAALLDRLRETGARVRARPPEPVRLVHHFACTGGTLICKYLAATPNARLLSEVDPLSPIPKLRFSPSDLILLYRNTVRPTEDAVAEEIFLAGLKVIHDHAQNHGERVILRDHSHSHFCTGPEIPARRTLLALVSGSFATRAVVTVRHPLDSYLSLLNNAWEHFSPDTLDEYARRYHAFLDAHAGVPLFSYEDFVADTETVLEAMCDSLALSHAPGLSELIPAIRLTGDSGRRSTVVGRRKRREIPPAVAAERARSPVYADLCARLGYTA